MVDDGDTDIFDGYGMGFFNGVSITASSFSLFIEEIDLREESLTFSNVVDKIPTTRIHLKSMYLTEIFVLNTNILNKLKVQLYVVT